MWRRLSLCALLALGAAAASAAAASPPTLHFRVFARTNLPLGQVLWTGRGFLYNAEDVGEMEVSDPHGANVEPYASLRQGGEEMRCATSLGRPWWPAGIYCHTPDNRVLRFSPDGSTMTTIARLPSSAGRVSDGALAFDNVGLFAHRLLVASGGSSSNGGRVYAVAPSGRVAMVGKYPGPGGADNMLVAPKLFGSAGGSVVMSIDQRLVSGRVIAMDAHGVVTTLASKLANGVNPIQVIRSPPPRRAAGAAPAGIYFSDTYSKNVYFAPAAALRPYVGDVIVGGELKAWFWIIRPDAKGSFETIRLRTNLPSKKWGIESATYVP